MRRILTRGDHRSLNRISYNFSRILGIEKKKKSAAKGRIAEVPFAPARFAPLPGRKKNNQPDSCSHPIAGLDDLLEKGGKKKEKALPQP